MERWPDYDELARLIAEFAEELRRRRGDQRSDEAVDRTVMRTTEKLARGGRALDPRPGYTRAKQVRGLMRKTYAGELFDVLRNPNESVLRLDDCRHAAG